MYQKDNNIFEIEIKANNFIGTKYIDDGSILMT